ncbi:hypothetical protein THF1D04_50374 [Vibrio owensii]|uniref:Uncharacterized protein n=1 Tax=Vibrio owensii TaxID=696485 RepID=A0AAU9QAJ8_9VIBR|nr:hypothetical protein THF1D04_50374 [Vibrio owensii]
MKGLHSCIKLRRTNKFHQLRQDLSKLRVLAEAAIVPTAVVGNQAIHNIEFILKQKIKSLSER